MDIFLSEWAILTSTVILIVLVIVASALALHYMRREP